MFDDPLDIDCCVCGADLDELCGSQDCFDADGNRILSFHVERKEQIVLWNRFIKTGDFDIAPAARSEATHED